MTAEEVIRNLSKALINWYEFETDAEAIFISGGDTACESLYDAMVEKDVKVFKVAAGELEKSTSAGQKKYDYVVAAGILERSENPVKLLTRIKMLLKDSGRVLIGTENRLAIRHFCGDKDVFTGHVLDGIDGYLRINRDRKKAIGGQAYAKSELDKMLRDAGYSDFKFWC